MAKQVMESLIRTGRVSRGFIGVELQDVNREIAETFKLPKTEGSIVAAVQNGGPADRAGLKAGDVVVAVNETPSRNTAELLALVAALQPGQKAALQIIRNGRPQVYEVTVTERPATARLSP
jgi:serine protease DegQ